jgi:very-short-patch-repair endonuclease
MKPKTPKWSKEYLYNEYFIKDRSLYQIAADNDTYANAIRSQLLKYGYKLKDKSQAQAARMKRDDYVHPTKGRQRTDAEKRLIGEGYSKKYVGKSDEFKKKRADISRERYNNMSNSEVAEFRHKAAIALKQTTIEGSRLEKFLKTELSHLGYNVEVQRDNLIENVNLRLDLFLPEIRTAIEIDGPMHSRDLFGEPDRFLKKINRDNEKNGLLLQSGYAIIRISYQKKLSQARMRIILDKLNVILLSLKSDFPKKHEDRLIFLEGFNDG